MPQRGAHLALGILLLWIACVCYYVAFTMGHSVAHPGYLAKTERQLASNLQTVSGAPPAFTSTALVNDQTGGSGALGLTEGGGV